MLLLCVPRKPNTIEKSPVWAVGDNLNERHGLQREDLQKVKLCDCFCPGSISWIWALLGHGNLGFTGGGCWGRAGATAGLLEEFWSASVLHYDFPQNTSPILGFAVGWIASPKGCRSPNPNVVGLALIQYDSCFHKKQKFGHRDTSTHAMLLQNRWGRVELYTIMERTPHYLWRCPLTYEVRLPRSREKTSLNAETGEKERNYLFKSYIDLE